MTKVFLGVDIGTSSSKGVLVGSNGEVLASATREHDVRRPAPGKVEMDGRVWWDEFCSLATELVGGSVHQVAAVGVSGMGPCVLLTDEQDDPVRPAILYGVDTRSGAQQEACNSRYGPEEILRRCGSAMSSQAAGAKVAWVAEHEPEVYARARRLFMPSSWLVRKLTGEYVLDHHSASQSTPMYDVHDHSWIDPWAGEVAPGIELPPLRWADEVAGRVTAEAAARTSLAEGIPVITGTIDAWSEAISVDAHNTGDLMLMYGTTMFLINTVAEPVRVPALWGPVGALQDTFSLAGGMATSGAITAWLRDLYGGVGYAQLAQEAAEVPAGAEGLLMLPYFAGERTPIMDPSARGVIAGLTLSHGRAHIYRAALEATAFGVRHNIETMLDAGASVGRVVAVGGGLATDLWPQIVTDVTGVEQVIPERTIGASYGAAYLAATQVSDVAIRDWNPPRTICRPDPDNRRRYDERYRLYRQLYDRTRDIAHALASADTDDHAPAASEGDSNDHV
ncbi:sugar kinase [Flexivirga endophytica]|uniref:Sugar kinase n=1 Tax=Flexivirga endophytica TaxID=1849103 RepID=A0A916SWV7_9MICO|nr:FGGY family carbohydrate kinase [Flexivirga endophytica]GGB17810.1 sugar kinase [Flexivirga endophytica]GHB37796.1 sugar kinase [Flexivirga endophytica]